MTGEEQNLHEKISGITGVDAGFSQASLARQKDLIKPLGSLGKLEEYAARLSAITKTLYPNVGKRAILIMAADNGVVAEGVASAPPEITAQQTLNFVRGTTGVAVLARQAGADLRVFDIGVNADLVAPGIRQCKVRKSTGNITKEAAMSRAEAVSALMVGFDAVAEAKADGYLLLGAGEMGIGNTTTSSAVLGALLELKGEELSRIVGHGAGIDEVGYERKVAAVGQAIAFNLPDASDPIDVLAKVGGLDLAGLCGVFLGAAFYQLPIVVDGFISAVAALCAIRLNPLVKDYLFLSHLSAEPGYAKAAAAIGLEPALNLGMRLGEGSGCPLLFMLLDSACLTIKEMATFAQAEVSTGYLEAIENKVVF